MGAAHVVVDPPSNASRYRCGYQVLANLTIASNVLVKLDGEEFGKGRQFNSFAQPKGKID